MSQLEPIFSVQNEWCKENGRCDEIILIQPCWDHIVRYHPEMAPYREQVRTALTTASNMQIWESPSAKPTLTFYARDLIDDPRFRECYVAVCVRYQLKPAHVWTAYLPRRIASNPGKLLYAAR